MTHTRSSSGKAASRDRRFPGEQGGRNAPSEPEDRRTSELSVPRPGHSTPSVPHLPHPALPPPGTSRNRERSGSPRCREVSGGDVHKPTPGIRPQSSTAGTALTSTGAKMAGRGREAPPRGLVGCTPRPSPRLGRLPSAGEKWSGRGSTQPSHARELYFLLLFSHLCERRHVALRGVKKAKL